MRLDSMRASLERVHGDTGERRGVSVESYLDRWSASGAEEDAASGVDVRSVLQRARRARVTSLDSGGGPCVPVEGVREGERDAKGGMRDRAGLMAERGRERRGERESWLSPIRIGAKQPLPIFMCGSEKQHAQSRGKESLRL